MLNQLSSNTAPVLSYFTHALREMCTAKGAVAACMRNGEWVKVEYVDGGFQSTDKSHQWHADGNSTVGHRFDLVEFRPATDVLNNWLPLAVDVQMHRAAATPASFWH